jgi:hypothetical protein
MHGLPVGAVARQRVRITRAVHTLVVPADKWDYVPALAERLDDPCLLQQVPLNHLELLGSQSSVFVQNCVWFADFADVVEGTAASKDVNHVFAQPDLARERQRVPRHSVRVAMRVRDFAFTTWASAITTDSAESSASTRSFYRRASQNQNR